MDKTRRPDPEPRAAAAWAHFSHGADIGIRGTGPDLQTAFEQVALALTGVICRPEAVRAERTIHIECTGEDEEFLLVN